MSVEWNDERGIQSLLGDDPEYRPPMTEVEYQLYIHRRSESRWDWALRAAVLVGFVILAVILWNIPDPGVPYDQRACTSWATGQLVPCAH